MHLPILNCLQKAASKEVCNLKQEYVSPEFEAHKYDFELIMTQITPSQNDPDYKENHDDSGDSNLGD